MHCLLLLSVVQTGNSVSPAMTWSPTNMHLQTDQHRNERTRLLPTLRNIGGRADSAASHALHGLLPVWFIASSGSPFHILAQPGHGSARPAHSTRSSAIER